MDDLILSERDIWALATVVAGVAAFGSFAWGMKHHFRVGGRMPSRMRQLSAASTAAFLLFVALAFLRGVGPIAGAIAVAFFLAGGALFWWAVRTTRAQPPAIAHSDDAPTTVHATGPYAFVRHPFYLSYGLGWLATAIAAGPIQWLPAALILAWYHRIAREEEARFAASGLATAYATYRERTGFIVPRRP